MPLKYDTLLTSKTNEQFVFFLSDYIVYSNEINQMLKTVHLCKDKNKLRYSGIFALFIWYCSQLQKRIDFICNFIINSEILFYPKKAIKLFSTCCSQNCQWQARFLFRIIFRHLKHVFIFSILRPYTFLLFYAWVHQILFFTNFLYRIT